MTVGTDDVAVDVAAAAAVADVVLAPAAVTVIAGLAEEGGAPGLVDAAKVTVAVFPLVVVALAVVVAGEYTVPDRPSVGPADDVELLP